MKNYYEILEVNEKASQEIISKVFKIHIKKWHPDLYQGEKKIEAENKTKEINEAYSVLSNETKRMEYDTELALQKGPTAENYEIETLRQENEMLRRDIEKRDMIINNLANPSSDTAKRMHYYYEDYYQENEPQDQYYENENNTETLKNTKLLTIKDLLIKILLCFLMLLLGSIIIYMLIENASLLDFFK